MKKKVKIFSIRNILILITIALIAILIIHLYSFRKNKEINVIYIPKAEDISNDFWTTLIEGAKMAAYEYNVDLKILAPESESDYEKQNELLLKAAKAEPDVIVVSPISYTKSNETLKKVKKEYGIPIIFIDSTTSEKIQTAAVSSDNVEGSRRMGEYAKEIIDSNAKIAIVSHVPNSSTAIEREEGFKKGLGDLKENIVDVVYSYSNFTTAYEVTKDLLTRHPDISLIAGLNEYSAIGAANAIKSLQLEGKVKLIGFDNSISAVNMLEEKVLNAIVIQKPYNMGYLGIETAYKVASRKPYDKYIDSGCELITIDDMYTEQGQKSLFSFLD